VRCIPHRSRKGVARRFPCHVTLKMRADVPNLRNAKLVRALEASFAALGDAAPTRLAHYSIQGDHVHLIVEARDHDALGRGMKAISARIARADPEQPLDPASSSRWFTGWRDLDIRATSPPTTKSSPVMTPRTWLLAVGWRKHGLLDPREVPGRVLKVRIPSTAVRGSERASGRG